MAHDGPIPRGGTDRFCEPATGALGAARRSLAVPAAGAENDIRSFLPYVPEPFDVPAVAALFNDPDPQLYLRNGTPDSCDAQGFGWVHILQGHAEDFASDQLSPSEEQALREALTNAPSSEWSLEAQRRT